MHSLPKQWLFLSPIKFPKPEPVIYAQLLPLPHHTYLISHTSFTEKIFTSTPCWLCLLYISSFHHQSLSLNSAPYTSNLLTGPSASDFVFVVHSPVRRQLFPKVQMWSYCSPSETCHHVWERSKVSAWYSQPFKALENFSGKKWAVTKQTIEKARPIMIWLLLISPDSSLTTLCYKYIGLLTGPSSTIISSPGPDISCFSAWNALPVPCPHFTWQTPTLPPFLPRGADPILY